MVLLPRPCAASGPFVTDDAGLAAADSAQVEMWVQLNNGGDRASPQLVRN